MNTYIVVLYKNDKRLPFKFHSYKSADDFIAFFHLHAYITII